MDFTQIERHIVEMRGDVYEQKPDPGHTQAAEEVIGHWLPVLNLAPGSRVLDVGCGQGFTKDFFEIYGLDWAGITLGPDFAACQQAGLPVECRDFTFDLADIPDNTYDFIFARHALEHSPAPMLTLFEWHRICKQYVGLVLPTFEHNVVASLNHYVLLTRRQWLALIYRAGFHVMYSDGTTEEERTKEYRLVLRKGSRPPAPYDYIPFLNTAANDIPADQREAFMREVANARV